MAVYDEEGTAAEYDMTEYDDTEADFTDEGDFAINDEI